MFARFLLLALFVANTHAYVWHRDENHHGSLKQSMLSENRFPKQPQIYKVVTGVTVEMIRSNASNQLNVCEECKSVVKEIQQTLDDPKAVARYKQVIKMICLMATRHPTECEVFVNSVEMMLESMKETMKDPQRCCHELHLCDERPNLISRIILLGLKSMNFEIQASQNGLTSVDILCDECLFMSNELAAILSDPDYQKNLQVTLKKLCDVIPQVKDECKSTIDAYAPAVFQEVLEYLANPRPFCMKIGFCKPTEQSWYRPAYLTEADEINDMVARPECPFAAVNADGTPGSCMLCEEIVDTALESLKSEAKLLMLEEVALSMCSSLPLDWKAACNDWITTYFKYGVLSLLADVSTTSVCNAMHACTASDRFKMLAMTNSERKLGACKACKTYAEIYQSMLKEDRRAVETFENLLNNMCQKGPNSATTKCYLQTEKIVKKFNDYISGKKKADSACFKFGICDKYAIEWR